MVKEIVKINVGILDSNSNADLELNLSPTCSMKSQEWQDEAKIKLASIYKVNTEDIELDWYFKPKISAYNELFKDFASAGKNYRLMANVKGNIPRIKPVENKTKDVAEEDPHKIGNYFSYGSISYVDIRV